MGHRERCVAADASKQAAIRPATDLESRSFRGGHMREQLAMPVNGKTRAFDDHNPPDAELLNVRPLRLLLANLPHIHSLGEGDGLPTRPHSLDEYGDRRRRGIE